MDIEYELSKEVLQAQQDFLNDPQRCTAEVLQDLLKAYRKQWQSASNPSPSDKILIESLLKHHLSGQMVVFLFGASMKCHPAVKDLVYQILEIEEKYDRLKQAFINAANNQFEDVDLRDV